MKISYKNGDLLKSGLKLIGHGCNAQGVMGSGIAKAIKEKYPECYTAYSCFMKDSGKLGDVLAYTCPSDNVTILNMITQEFYGRDSKRYVSYEAIEKCMTYANRYAKDNGHVSLGLPKIGAGLGGGDWKIISEIIEKTCKDIQVEVYEL